MPTQVPPEILDIIIAFSATDIRTLKMCSLASSVFLPSTRPHLFREVTLSSPARADTAYWGGDLLKLKAMLRSPKRQPAKPRNRCHQLSLTLCSSPHLTPYVRRLRIDAERANLINSEEPTLYSVLDSFSFLEAIEIQFSETWQGICPDIHHALGGLFLTPTLKEIVLQNGWVYLDALKISPSVQSLVFDRTSVGETEGNGTTQDHALQPRPLYFTCVTSISGSFQSLAVYTTSPAPRPDIPNLCSITLSWGDNNYTHAAAIVEHCGSSLRDLTLLDEGTMLKGLNLSRCTGLKTLRIKSALGEDQHLPPWWAAALSTACPTLQELHIRIVLVEPFDVTKFHDWGLLNEALALHYACRIVICSSTNDSKFLALIKATLSGDYTPFRRCFYGNCLCKGTGYSCSLDAD